MPSQKQDSSKYAKPSSWADLLKVSKVRQSINTSTSAVEDVVQAPSAQQPVEDFLKFYTLSQDTRKLYARGLLNSGNSCYMNAVF